MKLKISLIVLIFALFSSFVFIQNAVSDETLTITTYYPSPYGSYHELRSQKMAIGTDYIDSSKYCWSGTCTSTIPPATDLIVQGNVGIGTPTPGGKLTIQGDGTGTGIGLQTQDSSGAAAVTMLDDGTITAKTVNATTSYQANGTAGLTRPFFVVKSGGPSPVYCTIQVTEGIVTSTSC